VRTLRQRAVVVVAAAALAAGCASRKPAPVVDRLPPPAPTAAPAAPAGPQYYTVKRGDTLYSIALDHGLDWRELAGMNAITDPTRLRLGQQLVVKPAAPAPVAEGPVVVSPIAPSAPVAARPLGADAAAPAPGAPAGTPAATGALKTEPKGLRLPYSVENLALVQRGDAARTAAVPPATPVPASPPAKPEGPPAAKPDAVPPVARAAPDPGAAQIDWSWPAAGKVTGGFNGSSNKGIDIGGKVGDPVFASAAGVVQYVGEGIPSLGKLVIVKHGDTYLSAYAHNSEILVKESQKVTKGQQIAKMGATGTDQPKLHFEIRRQGAPLDPLQYLPQR
jgi:lipoprotein NlpD